MIQERILVLELREHEQSPEFRCDDERTVKLHKPLKAWPPKHRRISLAGVLDVDGREPTGTDDSAARLASLWAQ
eukprot:7531713-Pyramimonas_sp.AAC.1